jgi:hypothetical protein
VESSALGLVHPHLKCGGLQFLLNERISQRKRLSARLRALSFERNQSSRKSGGSSSEPQFTSLEALRIPLKAG